MSEHKPTLPTCIGCDCRISYDNPIPQRKYGIMLRMGGQYCAAGKKARMFKRRDPLVRVPTWCPKRKTPCEVRVYTFRDPSHWTLHRHLAREIGHDLSPSGYEYALSESTVMKLTPMQFWKRLEEEPDHQILGFRVATNEVVEIDDGLKSCFFYKGDGGAYQYLYSFNVAAAMKKHKEDSV